MLVSLIFDVDGTLAETEEFHRRAFNAAFTAAGLDWNWDRPLYTELLKVTGGRERILHFIKSRLGAPVLDAETLARDLHQAKNRLYGEFVAGQQIPLRPGIQPLIDEALKAGLRLGIATTTSPANVEALLGATLGANWRSIFPVVVAGDMAPLKKPAPDVFRLAIEALGIAPSQAIAIEDSRNGVLAACGAGLRVVCLRSIYCADDDLTGAAAVFDDANLLTVAKLLTLGAAIPPPRMLAR